MEKIWYYVLATAVVVGGIGFYGGMKYGAAQAQNQAQQARSQRTQQFAGGNFQGGQRTGGTRGAGFLTGSILSKDSQSITIKTQDGSSKIVFFSNSTNIEKPTTISSADLSDGDNVMVNGSTNTDGSVTAESIQIRPQMMQDQK